MGRICTARTAGEQPDAVDRFQDSRDRFQERLQIDLICRAEKERLQSWACSSGARACRHDSIVIYDVLPSGELSGPKAHVPTGKHPRNFNLVSRHDIAGIWVAFFSRWQRDRC